MLITRRNRRGQAYLEFVIVLPLILLLIFLAWEFAYFWWSRAVASSATFEATRVVASGGTPAEGYALYNDLLSTGLGQMANQYRGGFSLTVQPASRSVRARASVPWQWPTGLGGLMGGGLNLTLKSSTFFRLEEFYPGPPGTFE